MHKTKASWKTISKRVSLFNLAPPDKGPPAWVPFVNSKAKMIFRWRLHKMWFAFQSTFILLPAGVYILYIQIFTKDLIWRNLIWKNSSGDAKRVLPRVRIDLWEEAEISRTSYLHTKSNKPWYWRKMFRDIIRAILHTCLHHSRLLKQAHPVTHPLASQSDTAGSDYCMGLGWHCCGFLEWKNCSSAKDQGCIGGMSYLRLSSSG